MSQKHKPRFLNERGRIAANVIFMAGILFLVLALSGCGASGSIFAAVDKVSEMAGVATEAGYENVAQTTDRYCKNVPESRRQQIRAGVNSKTQHSKIFIICAGDKNGSDY